MENLRKNLEYFDFDGVPVPYVPASKTTFKASDGNWTTRSVPPAYPVNLKQYLETGSMVALRNALTSMTKEALLSLVRAMAFKEKGWEAPIAVSSGVPVDHVYLDFRSGRIVLNEWQATQKYIDADGDRAVLLFNEDRSQAVLVKFPITSAPMILTVMKEAPQEKFMAFTKRMATALLKKTPVPQLTDNPELEEEYFYKKHVDIPVGVRTNAHNAFDLWSSRNMTWEEKNGYIFNSHIDPISGKTQRALDIEDAAMKAARKTGVSLEEAWVLEEMKRLFGAAKALNNETAWALTSCSSIGDMNLKQLSWFDNADLDTLTSQILRLEVGFRNVKAAERSVPKLTFIEGQLLARLKALNLIGWADVPHRDPNMPPSCLFWLQLPNNNLVALTDVKRDNKDVGLTYMFMLAPVYDNVDLYSEDGELKFPATHQWMHPIEHMKKMIMTFDSTVRPYHDGPISHYFPADLQDWNNPKRAIKIGALQKWLSDYCGEYGDPAPATKTAKGIVPSKLALSVISRTVVIDYGSEMNHLDMYKVAKQAKQTCNFCMVGSKSTSRRIRKYMLANEKGGSCLDFRANTNPYRGACSRSQLLRGLGQIKMTIAVVKAETLCQLHITPTGIQKQATNIAFLPQVFNTLEEWEQHVAQCYADAEEVPTPTVVEYPTWQGEARRCWTTDARRSILIGKLIDTIGNKAMPRGMGQVYYKDPKLADTIPVDLLFPIDELVAKDAQHEFLQGAEERTIYLPDGTSIKALIVEREMIRTGAGSENIPARFRYCLFKGIDSFPIWWRLNMIKPLPPRECDTSFAKELQSVKKQILQRLGAVNHDESRSLDEYVVIR